MIEIGKIYKEVSNTSATLICPVTIDKETKEIWFKVSPEYSEYLCDERADAYVVATLHYALTNGHDIKAVNPISEQLLFNLRTYLIPALLENNPDMHNCKIIAEVATDKLPNAGAVGTGISCGVDSLHVLASKCNSEYKHLNITHLTFNNVGSHGEGEKAQTLYKARLSRPEQFAKEYGFKFVASDSNLMDVVKQDHFKTHTYSSMFPVLCLQKLFSTYFYASGGYKFNEFNLHHSSSSSCGAYELLSLQCFSTDICHIMSDGMGATRLMKLREVVNYPPSYKYLNVCLHEGDNCSKCEKCVRTLLGLDALGMVDKYSEVFDTEYYKRNRKWYIQQLLYRIKDKKHDYFEMYPYFKRDVTISMRLKAQGYASLIALKNLIRRNRGLYKLAKKLK